MGWVWAPVSVLVWVPGLGFGLGFGLGLGRVAK